MMNLKAMALAAAAVALLAAPGAGAPPTVEATNDNTWEPRLVSVQKGTRVRFSNTSDGLHDLKRYKGPWKSGTVITMYPEDAWTYRFTKPGTYKYRCVIHSEMADGRCTGMCGKVRSLSQ